jgi:hypothetical protein
MRMRRLAEAAVAVSILVLSGQAPVWAQGGKTPKLAAVPLSVVIESAVTPTALNPEGVAAITGDGDPYVDGEMFPLRANFDGYGNLIIAFGRLVRFEYGSPLSGTRPAGVTGGPVSGWHSGAYISTLNRSGELPLQTLAFGASQCVKLNWQYDHPDGGWWLHGYNRGFDQKENGTSYAVVHREGPDVWTVEPLGGSGLCGPVTNPESTASVSTQRTVKGKWEIINYGNYFVPFKLTLTRKS